MIICGLLILIAWFVYMPLWLSILITVLSGIHIIDTQIENNSEV